jgi:MFS family permease
VAVTAQADATARRGMGALLAAAFVSLTGDGALMAAAPLLAATLTSDPVAVAAVTAAAYLPWLVIGLPAGALVDRWDRRTVMIGADLLRAGLLAVLVVLVVTTTASVAVLAGLVFTVGMAGCFFDAASQATIPALVGRDEDDLTRANSRLWSADTLGRQLAGPPAGATAFTASAALPFLGDLVSFLVSAAFLTRIPRQPHDRQRPRQRTLLAVREGLAHLWSTSALRAALAWAVAYNLAYNSAYAMLVLYTTRTLGLSDAGYGVLVAVMAAGALAGAQLAPRLPARVPAGAVMAGTLVVSALAWAALVLAPHLATAVLALVVVGACTMLGTVVLGTIRQVNTPDRMLGRVVATFRLFGIGASGLGALAGGALAHLWGLHAAFLAAPVFAVMGVLLIRILRGGHPAP